MRVLHINGNYIYSTLHQLMIRNLNELGIENYVFVPVHDKYSDFIVPDENVKVVACFKKRDRYWFEYKQKKIIQAVESLYDIKSFDLIHAYTLFTDGNCAHFLSQKYQIPYVVAVRNTDINAFFKYRILLRRLGIKILKDASSVFFLSKAYRDLLLRKYVPSDFRDKLIGKTRIIPNGIDDFWFQNKFTKRNYDEINARIRNKELRLVYVGTIDNNKNIKLTVTAMGILKKEGWHVTLDVVGPITEDKAYNGFKNDPSVHYIPKKPKEEIIKYYVNADIFVMPSVHETFGLVYAEAMSQGLPVIYTRGQGFDKHFEEGEVGYSVDSNSINEMCGAIKSICNNYEEISKCCIKKVERFRWGIIVQKYVQCYKELNYEDENANDGLNRENNYR